MAVAVAVFLGIAVAWSLLGVVDALRQPDDAWQRAEQSRSTWIAVLLLLPLSAPAYWFSVRRQLLTA